MAKILRAHKHSVRIFKGHDGKVVIQIDTPHDPPHIAENGQPVCRVRINDARIWEGFEDGTEEYGDDDDYGVTDESETDS